MNKQEVAKKIKENNGGSVKKEGRSWHYLPSRIYDKGWHFIAPNNYTKKWALNEIDRISEHL